MMCYKDKTWCKSPNCKNKCGRKISPEEIQEADLKGLFISWLPFCDDKGELIKEVGKHPKEE